MFAEHAANCGGPGKYKLAEGNRAQSKHAARELFVRDSKKVKSNGLRRRQSRTMPDTAGQSADESAHMRVDLIAQRAGASFSAGLGTPRYSHHTERVRGWSFPGQ
jgi:hypothetical protein